MGTGKVTPVKQQNEVVMYIPAETVFGCNFKVRCGCMALSGWCTMPEAIVWWEQHRMIFKHRTMAKFIRKLELPK